MEPNVLVPLGVFAMVVAIVVIPAYFKTRERREMQKTLRAAIDSGQPLPTELVNLLGKENVKQPASATSDLRTGVILIATALGVLGFGALIGMASDEQAATYAFAGFAAVPGAIGLAYVILSFFNKNKG